ncbi:glutamine--fructose-6-phosphate transaminase (isomerizing) [bacterium]|nr:glutamine--fructose-6-phosphate transaminase (isomerizing) [bacterium]
MSCGIVAYVGPRKALPVLFDTLKRLEYRGYDSAGVALLTEDGIFLAKQKGKIKDLEERLKNEEIKSGIGIGHTRWATHGRPSDFNAHPHLDCNANIAVVHNGIIENYSELREELKSRGHNFRSETDTEVIPHLLEENFSGDPLKALQKAVSRLQGSYAVAAIFKGIDKVFFARKDSPLIIGLGEGENFLASDIPAVLPYTKKVIVLEDGDTGFISSTDYSIFQGERQIERKIMEVPWDQQAAERGGFEHFMIKEILEQDQSIRDTLRERLREDGDVDLSKELAPLADKLPNLRRIFIVACGTAYYAGMAGKYFIESLLGIPVEIDIASEFRYRAVPVMEGDWLILVSQSGETADTLAALRDMKKKGVPTVGIVNAVGSSIARESDVTLYTRAGPEICVASTKAYTAQVTVFYLLGLYLAKVLRGMDIRPFGKELLTLPQKVAEVLAKREEVEMAAEDLYKERDFFFIGRGMDYGVALEGALKLKEISYLRAEAFAAGELKHGPLALIYDGVPVVAVVTQEALRDKTISNIEEVWARGARVIGVLREGDPLADELSITFTIPNTIDYFTSPLAVIPLQMLAYYISRKLGREIDQPRNLAKSVTVE